MKEVIQFSDNLFYITELIKTISTAAELNISEQLFSEKIIGDISFISRTLDRLTELLIENSGNRISAASLRSLLKARAAFKTTLEEIAPEHCPLFSPESEHSDYVKVLIESQENQIQRVINAITEMEQAEDNSVFISSEEMDLLLKE